MAENVETGGLMSFRYGNEKRQLDEDKKREIREAYARANERKRKERRNRIVFWIIVVLIIILGIGAFLFF